MNVESDFPIRPVLSLAKGQFADAVRNPHGAVSAKVANGKLLGLKPGEYEIIRDDQHAERIENAYREGWGDRERLESEMCTGEAELDANWRRSDAAEEASHA
jgi:hypothetical protein